MKNVAGALLLLFVAVAAGADDLPQLTQPVNDFAHVIDAQSAAAMDNMIRELKVRAKNDIPIGHKLAIRALSKDATVIKYGTDIGRAVAAIQVGEHAHVHNIKTKRW